MKLVCYKPFNEIFVRNPYLVNVLKINLIYLQRQININKNSDIKLEDMINKDKDLLIKFNHRTGQTLEITPYQFRNFIKAIFIYNNNRKDIKPNIIKTQSEFSKFVKEIKSLSQSLKYYAARTALGRIYLEINNIDGIKNISDKDFNRVKTWANKAYLSSYYGTPRTGESAFYFNVKHAIGFNILVPYKIVLKLRNSSIPQLEELKEMLVNSYNKNIKRILSIKY